VITARYPTDWRGLERDVAIILGECGFSVEVEKTVQLARGHANIDVHAVESVGGRIHTIFCECKLWQSAIPQSVIHGFRTVVADGGANVGYVITSSDYQRGALSAAELTNLRLVTWPEFQMEFESTWINNYFLPKVTERLDPLMTYVEPLLPKAFDDLDADGKQRFLKARERHVDLGAVAMMFSTYMQILSPRLPDLPLSTRYTPSSPSAVMPEEVLAATAYRDLLQVLLAAGDQAIGELQQALGLPPGESSSRNV
jgi:restriction system protein